MVALTQLNNTSTQMHPKPNRKIIRTTTIPPSIQSQSVSDHTLVGDGMLLQNHARASDVVELPSTPIVASTDSEFINRRIYDLIKDIDKDHKALSSPASPAGSFGSLCAYRSTC